MTSVLSITMFSEFAYGGNQCALSRCSERCSA